MEKKEKRKNRKTTKKIYYSPKLVIYGDIRRITQASAMGSTMDSTPFGKTG